MADPAPDQRHRLSPRRLYAANGPLASTALLVMVGCAVAMIVFPFALGFRPAVLMVTAVVEVVAALVFALALASRIKRR